MEKPTEEDCCHSDCVNCVLDIYQRHQSSKRPTTLKSANHINSLMSQTRYLPFRLMKIDIVALNVCVYSFVPDETNEGVTGLHFTPGEHVVLRNNPPTPDSQHLSRPYTLIPWNRGGGAFSVMIRLYPEGRMSELIKEWSIGQTCYWRGPYGDFTHQPNVYRHVFMICMGTGVAPMYALSNQIVENEDDETVIHLVYGSKTPDDIIFRNEISELSYYWNFTCTHFISEGYNANQKKFNENFIEGRITTERLEKLLICVDKTLVLICGSEAFNSNMRDKLKVMSEVDLYVFS